jgi:hypothetical protein
MKNLPLLFWCLGTPVFATVVNPQAIQKQMATATLVADIQVEALEGVQDSQFDVKSLASARVLKIHSLRDDRNATIQEGDLITVETPGGEIGETGVLYAGMPRAYNGKSYRATLRHLHHLTFGIVGLSAGLVPLTKERTYSRNRTDGSNGSGSGAFLYWDPSYFPIPYYISQPTFRNHEDMAAAVDLSFKPWRDPGYVSVEFLPMGCTSTVTNRNDGINAVILVTRDWPFDAAAIAITRNFYVSGSGPKAGLILDTDIMINAVDHEFSTTGDPVKNDVRNILTHEVGHLLGMGHEAEPSKDTLATMYENALPGETNKRALHRNDLAALNAAYGGVGQKFAQFASTDSCALGTQRLSCAATHGARRSGTVFGWILLALTMALACGRRFMPKQG